MLPRAPHDSAMLDTIRHSLKGRRRRNLTDVILIVVVMLAYALTWAVYII